MVSVTEGRGCFDQAFRVQKFLAKALNYAILQGWMPRHQNPATKQKGEEITDPQQLVDESVEFLTQTISYLSRSKRKGGN